MFSADNSYRFQSTLGGRICVFRKIMIAYLLVAIGGMIGSVGRYWLSGFVGNRVGGSFPWGTILVNITGCFVIGIFAALTSPDGRWARSPRAILFCMYGICGGYTTFSSFSLQAFNQLQNGEWLHAGENIGISVLACLVATWLGYMAGSVFNTMKGS